MHLTRHLPVLAARPVRIHASGLVLLIIYAASTTGTGYKFHAITPHVVSRYNVMEKLEPGRTVSCETGFIPHLTRHAKPFLFPYESNLDIHYRECEFILFDQQGNPWPLSKTDLESSINAVIIDRDAFKIVAHEDGVYLIQNLKKNNAGLRKWMQSIAAQGCGSRCQPRGQDHSHS